MTLILGVVAQRVAHQVGDRLVVVERGRTRTPHDPLSNKQVVVMAPDAIVAIGYTGLAYLDGRPTDDIIAEAAAGRPLGHGMQFAGEISPIHAVADRIAERLDTAVANDARFGVEVVMTGLKRGHRDRLEPLQWEITKRPGAAVKIVRGEQTPFDWRTKFSLQAIGDVHPGEVTRLRGSIKAVEEQGIERRDAVTRLLVETVRRTSEQESSTVGADCMVVRLWRDGAKAIAEVEYRPMTRERVTIERTERPFSFPAAYSPWFVSPGLVYSPAVVKGGGWTSGNVEFRILVPDTRGEEGPSAYFGSQERQPPPA
ncbi:MAG TPA: hypothetical protein VL086_09185 [Candidatus Nitrosotalea sp.]|nr:hypothetical protein [Candidatus Nitrosotalea sp.]